MKLIINYDFINKIKDIKEPYNVMKIVRNNKKAIFGYFLPTCIAVDIPIFLMSKKNAYITFCSQIISYFLINYFLIGDIYKENAELKLQSLIPLLKDINVNTSYDLLLKSKVYEKKYKIYVNEDKIPEILEEKYILIPTYNFQGEVREVSILQEHVVCSDNYILSFGEPEKKLRLVYSVSKLY